MRLRNTDFAKSVYFTRRFCEISGWKTLLILRNRRLKNRLIFLLNFSQLELTPTKYLKPAYWRFLFRMFYCVSTVPPSLLLQLVPVTQEPPRYTIDFQTEVSIIQQFTHPLHRNRYSLFRKTINWPSIQLIDTVSSRIERRSRFWYPSTRQHRDRVSYEALQSDFILDLWSTFSPFLSIIWKDFFSSSLFITTIFETFVYHIKINLQHWTQLYQVAIIWNRRDV